MGRCQEADSRCKPRFEVLEPRLLLSGAHLPMAGPWLPAGDPAPVLHVADGDPRVVNWIVDMGAYGLPGPVGGAIRGGKFHDVDGDGVRDGGEPGLEGWTIYVDADQDGEPGAGEPSAVTDSNGNYALTNLPPGTHTVAEVPQDGWGQTFPQAPLSSPECVSLAADGSFASDESFQPRLSADGRYVAFGSEAPLVPEDTNEMTDVYVRDRETGALEWVSMAADGGPGRGPSFPGGISAHGRYVTFGSLAPDLVPNDTNQEWDTFVYDRQTGALERISLAWDGSQSVRGGANGAISDDGRYVAFVSRGELVPDDTNGHTDVFVYDRQLGAVERVSIASDGSQANGASQEPEISSDGRYVSFQTGASNLVPGDTNGRADIMVHDRQTGTTERVSVASDGSQGTGWCVHPALSGDGRFVAFRSNSPELVPGVDTYKPQVFVCDRQTRTVQHANAAFDGGTPNHGVVAPPAISNDGRYVAFTTLATDIVPGDTNGESDAFVFDRHSGTTRRVSLAAGGLQANDGSYFLSLSGDGRVVAFKSSAGNLVAGDTNEKTDVFVTQLALAGTHTVVLDPGEVVEDVDFGNRQAPGMICGTKYHDLNGDGVRDDGEPGLRGWTIFVDADHDGQLDPDEPSAVTAAYGRYVLRGLPPGTHTVAEVNQDGWLQTFPSHGGIERVDVAADGSQSDGRSFHSAFSADGRYLAFRSGATNLVPDDTNGKEDLFLADRQTGAIRRISLACDGSQADGDSDWPTLSADGRFVAFESDATNLVPGGSSPANDVYVYDRQTNSIECASMGLGGSQGGGYWPAISADGRFVTFTSRARNLVPGDTNGEADIFVHDRRTGTTERVSIASDGSQTDRFSFHPEISADGRFVTFYSGATTLVPGDTNGESDVFVYDRQTDTIGRVSLASDGSEGDGDSFSPSISADGRYVAFLSRAANLVAEDTNGSFDIFLHDRQTATTRRVSVASDGSEADGDSHVGVVSGDGRYVAFYSHATNLVPGDTNGEADVFVHDCQTGATRRVSMAFDGSETNEISHQPAISADGRFVAFQSRATNLVPGDTNGALDIFVVPTLAAGRPGRHVVSLDPGQVVVDVDFGNRQLLGEIRGGKFHDLDGDGVRDGGEPGLEGWTIYVDADQDGRLDTDEPWTVTDGDGGYALTDLLPGEYTLAEVPQYGWEQTAPWLIERVSVSADGTEGDDRSFCPSISADGRYVAFSSGASHLVPGDTNGCYDVFVHDRRTGAVERVSLASDGSQGGGGSWRPAISADGRFVAFESCAMNFVAGGWGDDEDTQIFVYDRQTRTIQCASLSLTGRPGSNTSRRPAISADGRYVAYVSCAFDLVPNDTNDENDIFVFDRQTDTIRRVSVASDGTQGNTDSDRPTISADGRYVAFESYAANLVPGDTNDENDVFVRDRQTGTTRRVSVASGGTQGNNDSSRPVISADGRYVAFTSYASNLAPGDTNPWSDVFVHDRQTGALQWASAAPDGSPSNNNSYAGGLSADGRYLTVFSYASNLVQGDSGFVGDVFACDRQTGTIRRVGVSAEGTEGNGNSEYPVISADGRYVAFESLASNLVQGDTNGERDVFVCANTLAGAGTHRVALAGGQTVRDADFGNRRIDAPLIVSTTVDENDGDYSPGDLSLREALALAAGLPGDDVIEFHDSLVGGTILLDAGLGQLAIDSNVDVVGPGADRLTVDADGNGRVFHVRAGAVASIAGLTITGGWAEDPAGGPNAAGGGIYNLGTLALDAVVISGSHAGGGGGLCNVGTAVLTDVTLSGNSAREGGGIANYDPGVMTIAGSVISGSTLGGGIRNFGDLTLRAVTIAGNEGGGITNEGPLSIADSTISGNTTAGAGGGIQNYRYPLTVTNTTISGNSSTYRGGGLYVNGGSALLVNATVTDNRALCDGGGIFRYDGHGAAVTLHNTIVAGNFRGPQGEGSDVAGALDAASSHNLIGSAGGAARLGPLADNGGPTLTHALLPGSAALDAGSNDRAGDAGLTGDQRGFDRFLDGDGDGVATVDIGAYEAPQLPGPVLHVEGEVQFDGRGDYLVLEDHPKLNITEYTLAFWFKADRPRAGTQALIARGEDWASDKAQWIVELNDRKNRSKVQLWYEEANDHDHYFPTQTSIEADTWYHFAATRTADGEVTIYLDGQVELQRTDPAGPASVETPITLGARRNSPHRMQDYFDGTLREAFVYDAVLSADRINELMARTQPIGEGPVLELAGTTTFDGTEYIVVEDSPELNVTEYTIAFWFAADAPRDGTQALIARGEDWASDKAQWVVELNDRASRGKVQLWYEEPNDRDHYFPTQTSIEAGRLYHFAATRAADGEVTIYLDGQVELRRIDPADPASVETPITIGARRNSPHNVQDYFDGAIHHVLVYGRALDDARINELLAETRPECRIGDQAEVSGIGRQADIAVDPERSGGVEGWGPPNWPLRRPNAQIGVSSQFDRAPAGTFGQVAFIQCLYTPGDPPEQPLPVARPRFLAKQLDVAPPQLLGGHLREGSDLSVNVHVRLVTSRR